MGWFGDLFERGNTFEKGGVANRLFDPLDIFGGAKQDSYDRIAEGNVQSANALVNTSSQNQNIYDESYEEQSELLQPWVVAGQNALTQVDQQPDFKFTADTFEQFKDPGYEFRVSEGVNALDRSAASRGRLLSGAQDKAVTRYGQGMASQEYSNAFNRAKSSHDTNTGNNQWVANQGYQATNALASMNAQNAENKADTNMMSTNAMVDATTSNNQARSDTQNAISGGVGSGVGSIIGAITGSDFRFKNNISLVDNINGFNVYAWEWNDVAKKHNLGDVQARGVIAQEVLSIMPEAVIERAGYYYVDYEMIGISIKGADDGTA